jgi:hypothetical protein
MTTCEDRVGLVLYKYLAENKKATLISYHPPDGKAYATDLMRIPKKNKIAGSATRDRYHVDIIFIISNYLVLVELKCSLAESEHDISKLREIRDTYSLQELISIISRRLTTSNPKILENINQLVLALGYENSSANIELPSEFICFKVIDGDVSIQYGDNIPLAIKTQIF